MDYRDADRVFAGNRVVRLLSHVGRRGNSIRSSGAPSLRHRFHEVSQECDSERCRMKVCEKSAVKENAPAWVGADGLSSNFVLFSKFVVWGLWFPLVFISVIFLGRFWCGTLCPQGALTDYANKKSLNKPVPGLLMGGVVPVSSFIAVTIAGQVVGVRDYPLAALELFGITTLAAVLTGFIFARERRVWCRYLCPVGPLLSVFSRLGAISFENKNAKAKAYLCPTFINTQAKTATSNCIECFKCVEPDNPASLRISLRRPGREVEGIRKRDR